MLQKKGSDGEYHIDVKAARITFANIPGLYAYLRDVIDNCYNCRFQSACTARTTYEEVIRCAESIKVRY